MSASLECSVVIPSYNHGHLLERAVMSALECGAAEVVIVDDASTDNTEFVGRALHRDYTEVLYMRNNFRAGAIYSRNRAIDAATYDLILPLDADDMLLTILPLIEAIAPDTWVTGGWREYDTDYKCPPVGMLHHKELGWVTMLFWKGDWLRAGGYDPVFSIGNEVFAFQRALLCHGIQPCVISDTIFERNTDAPNTDRARAWAHVIRPLIDDRYPIRG
jgi:glycosyltransferase involved in cell wall biosynthesis